MEVNDWPMYTELVEYLLNAFLPNRGGKKSRESERETVENGTKAFTAAIMDYDNL